MKRYCECNFFVLCYYFCLELISSGSSIVPTKRSIENHSTVYAIFRGKGSFSISHFRFFLVHRIGAINLQYIFEVNLFSFKKKKNCINIYMYTGYIYTIVFDSNFVIIAVRKKYQKKKDE